ncbi:MAG: DUF4105 domain-containing protein [Proteobacteria bacterium]|nr:DUF4105 domain-containing protein [Pseudomonadota bacterium]
MRIFLIVLLLLLSERSEAASHYHRLEKNGSAEYWLKLLHYDEDFFGNYISRIDSPLFFAHLEGKHDPSKELDATIASFNDVQARVGYFKKHPQCVFVERYQFLKNAGLIRTKDLPCPDFNEWKKGIGAKSIVLVFSSSFPNNPASIFGHTFIRFKQEGENSLLDYSASYAAHTEGDTVGLRYAILGLLGGYKGRFVIAPYYMKVNEYNNSESRDLYEYELNLSQDGVERIVNHLWELYSTAYFDYFFIDENCSYILSKVLELGNPDWNLSDINRWFYIPSDSIKSITRIPGAVRKIHFRPSLKKQVLAKLNELSSEEQDLFFGAKGGKTALESIKNINVLDALIAYWNFRKREEKGAFSKQNRALFRKTLLLRARIEEKSQDIEVAYDEGNRPEFGHDPSRFSFGIGKTDDTTVYRLDFKAGLHDLLSNRIGIEPFSQIDFLGCGIEYDDEERKTNLTYITLIDIVSLHPYTSFDPRLSWKLGATYERIHDLTCNECYKYDVDFGAGGSFHLGTPNALLYVLTGAFGEASEYFGDSNRLGPFLEWSIIGNLSKSYTLQIKQTIRGDALNNFPKDYYSTTFLGQSFSWNRNWNVRLQSQLVSKYKSSEVQTYIHELQLGYNF